jgi:hypothetical protein
MGISIKTAEPSVSSVQFADQPPETNSATSPTEGIFVNPYTRPVNWLSGMGLVARLLLILPYWG